MKGLEGIHPREPHPGPCRAAQFASISENGRGPSEAWPIADGPAYGPRFGSPVPLEKELAATVRLALGVDATPDGSNTWPRIVEDMLDRAQSFDQEYGPTLRHPHDNPDDDGRFLVIVVRTGPADFVD